MKRLLLISLLFTAVAHGQILNGIMVATNRPSAATPTFSPVAGAVSNPTTVTASSTTSGTGCTMYFDTSNPPTTAQTTYSVTTAVTLYAQLRGCQGYGDSAVGSAAYTISGGHSFSVVQSQSAATCYVNSSVSTSLSCTMTGIASGDSVIGACYNGNGHTFTISSTPSPTLPITWSAPVVEYIGTFIISNITSGSVTISSTVTIYTGTYACAFAEVAGVVTSSPLDSGSATAYTATSYGKGATTNVTGSITTTNANDEVIAFGLRDNTQTFTPGTGYSTMVTTALPYIEYGTSILSSTQTVNPGLQWSNSSSMEVATIAVKLQ